MSMMRRDDRHGLPDALTALALQMRPQLNQIEIPSGERCQCVGMSEGLPAAIRAEAPYQPVCARGILQRLDLAVMFSAPMRHENELRTQTGRESSPYILAAVVVILIGDANDNRTRFTARFCRWPKPVISLQLSICSA